MSKITTFVVTGTKGKTSVVTLINHFLGPNYHKLLVSSEGVFLNSRKIASYQDSLINFSGRSPNVRPGRYVVHNLFRKTRISLVDQPKIAILESSLGCGKRGTGVEEYTEDGFHDIGIFTNVYSDHLNYTTLCSQQDIYQAKSFVFTKLKPMGKYIASLDNSFTYQSLREPVLLNKQAIKVGISQLKNQPDKLAQLAETLNLSDIFYLNEDNWVCSLTLGNLFKLTKFAYFFGQKPSGIVESLLFAVAACTDYVGLPDLTSRVRTFRFRLASGRLLGFQKDNQILILDYAHEIQSLNFLLNDFSYKFPNVRPWLITRVAPDRRDQYIQEYGQNIAKLNQIQKLIVYDKLTSKGTSCQYAWGERHPNETGQLLFDSIKQLNPNFLVEFSQNSEVDTLQAALASGYPLIIHIYSDIQQVLKFIRQAGFRRIL